MLPETAPYSPLDASYDKSRMPTGRPSLSEIPRKRSSLKTETTAPTCASAGVAETASRAANKTTGVRPAQRLAVPSRDRGPDRAAGTVTTAHRPSQRDAGIDR